MSSSEPSGDGQKREALLELRDRYVDARELGSPGDHANLEWILGARRNPTQDPLEFETKTIELVALWLEDLTLELERRPALVPGNELAADPSAAAHREGVVRKLRDATLAFLVAFRRGA